MHSRGRGCLSLLSTELYKDYLLLMTVSVNIQNCLQTISFIKFIVQASNTFLDLSTKVEMKLQACLKLINYCLYQKHLIQHIHNSNYGLHEGVKFFMYIILQSIYILPKKLWGVGSMGRYTWNKIGRLWIIY